MHMRTGETTWAHAVSALHLADTNFVLVVCIICQFDWHSWHDWLAVYVLHRLRLSFALGVSTHAHVLLQQVGTVRCNSCGYLILQQARHVRILYRSKALW